MITDAVPITIPEAGLSITLDSTYPFSRYVLVGSGTLIGNVAIAFSVTSGVKTQIEVEYRGQFNLGGNTINIQNYSLSQSQAITGNTLISATYTGAAWQRTAAFNSASNIGEMLGDTLVIDAELGDDTTAQRESLLYRFKTIDAAIAAAEANDEFWILNGTYAQTVPFTKNIFIRCEPLAVVHFGDGFNNNPYSVYIRGAGQLSCNDIYNDTSSPIFLDVECFAFTFKTISLPVTAFTPQNDLRIKASKYIICYTNVSILDGNYIFCTLEAPQLYFYNLYNTPFISAIDIENLGGNASYVKINAEVVEDVNNVSYKYDTIALCKKDVNATFDFQVERITVKNGVNNEIVLADNNVSATPYTNTFIVRDLIKHLGTTGSVVRSFNLGQVHIQGDVYVKQSENGLAIADTDANIASTIYFEDSNLYYEGTADNVCTLQNTNSRISFKNTKIISSTATKDVYGIIAASKYQALTLYSNLVQGANCSNEISGFIVRDALIK